MATDTRSRLPLDELRWENRFTSSLPADPNRENSRRQVEASAYSRVLPTTVGGPQLLAVSAEVAAMLGIDEATWRSPDFADVFSGNRVPAGADPFAMAYAGHQFGNWAGQLGDGRAIALGEVLDVLGRRQMLQLKGAGPTPYSRGADGRAVLRSSIREFLCSEAMHHLGVPTTRALSLVGTGDGVVRDMLYDGHPAVEPGAVVCRVSPSFTRFGNFQLPASRGDAALVRRLVEHTIVEDYPYLMPAGARDLADDVAFSVAVAAFFREVCERTADLVVHWLRVGFVHGVLNTDNMSILGLTIDYGPYGWLEVFDPGWTPNTTDAGTRRYRFGAQPAIVKWNLARLAEALLVVHPDTAPFVTALEVFDKRYERGFLTMMRNRLGWGDVGDEREDGDDSSGPDASDTALINDLFPLMARTETDFVLFFRHLGDVDADNADIVGDAVLVDPLSAAWYRPEDISGELLVALAGWLRRWAKRARTGGWDSDERRAVMNRTNPRFVLRNWIAQEVIDAAGVGDLRLLDEVLEVLRRPYDDQPGRERFAGRMPEWARHKVGCSMLSCSS